MINVSLQGLSVKYSGDNPAEAARTIAGVLGSLFQIAAPPPVASTEEPPAAIDENPAPRIAKTRRPRKAKSEEQSPAASNGAPSTSGHVKPVRSGPGNRPADKIAELIELRGPLSTTRLAQLMTSSETSVKKSIGHSRGRFLVNEDGDWILNPSRT